jgi:hypothetical protein
MLQNFYTFVRKSAKMTSKWANMVSKVTFLCFLGHFTTCGVKISARLKNFSDFRFFGRNLCMHIDFRKDDVIMTPCLMFLSFLGLLHLITGMLAPMVPKLPVC